MGKRLNLSLVTLAVCFAFGVVWIATFTQKAQDEFNRQKEAYYENNAVDIPYQYMSYAEELDYLEKNFPQDQYYKIKYELHQLEKQYFDPSITLGFVVGLGAIAGGFVPVMIVRYVGEKQEVRR